MFFFMNILMRNDMRPDILDFARQVVGHTGEIRQGAFHGATVAALKKKLVKKSSDSDPMKEEEAIGLLHYTC